MQLANIKKYRCTENTSFCLLYGKHYGQSHGSDTQICQNFVLIKMLVFIFLGCFFCLFVCLGSFLSFEDSENLLNALMKLE